MTESSSGHVRRDYLRLTARCAAEAEALLGALTDKDIAFLREESGRELEVLRRGRSGENVPGPAATRRQQLLRAYAEAVAITTHLLAPLTEQEAAWMRAEYLRQLRALRDPAPIQPTAVASRDLDSRPSVAVSSSRDPSDTRRRAAGTQSRRAGRAR